MSEIEKSQNEIYNQIINVNKKNDKITLIKLLQNVYKTNPIQYFDIACQIKDFNIIELLMSNNRFINYKDQNGDTPLMNACKYKNKNIVEMLIEKYGANVNLKNNNLDTPLSIACSFNCQNIFKLLILKGANKNVINKKGESILDIAIKNKNQCIIKYFLEIIGIDKKNNKGKTLLLMACEEKAIEKAKVLIENGANVNCKDFDDNTPLHFACKNGLEEIVNLLIKKNANINEKNKKQITPIFYAANYKNYQIMKTLIKNGASIKEKIDDNKTLLNIICSNGDELNEDIKEIINLLIYKNVDIFNTDNLNQLCKEKKVIDCIRKILNNERIDNEIPLVLYCKKNMYKEAKYLINFKVDVDIKDKNGNTPLILACKTKNFKLIKKLVDTGAADVNMEGRNGMTPLIILSYDNNNGKIIKFLIQKNCNIDKQNIEGDTALTVACYLRNKEIIKILLENKADCSLKNNKGESPKDIAEDLIEKYSSNFNFKKDRNDESPIHTSNSQPLSPMNICSISKIEHDTSITRKGSSSSKNSNNNNNNEEIINIIKFNNLIENSICKIRYIIKKKGKAILNGGTGFFLKLSILSCNKILHCLVTNNHVLNENQLAHNYKFKIYMKNKVFEIKLNNNMNFIFTSKFLDVTVVELSKEIIEKIKPNFLVPSNLKIKKKDPILVLQCPENNNSISLGIIKLILGFNFVHSSSTIGGSSGSALFDKQMNLIGIHKSKITIDENDNNEKNVEINLATSIKIIIYAVSVLYNERYIYGKEIAKLPAKELSINEIKELNKHYLKKTQYKNLFECVINSNTYKYPGLLFYRTNHSWYYTKKTEYDNDNISMLPWKIIPYKKETDIPYNTEDKNLPHLYKIIINWLSLTELKYLNKLNL